MMRSIFTKTMYQKRWSLLGWSVGIFAMVFFVMILFPTISQSGMFSGATADIPDSLKSLIGDLSKYKQIGYYIHQQVFIQMPFLTTVFAVILCSAILAGEENTGTLQTLMAQPVSRTKVYVQKLLACTVLIAAACLVVLLGLIFGLLIIDEWVSLDSMAAACFNLFVISLFVGILTLALGAITGKRGLAGALAGLAGFASYIISTLAVGVSALRAIDKLSPFRYYMSTNVFDSGLNASHIVILLSLTLFMAFAGWLVFINRDLA